jgi:hypothetical protein
LLRLGSAGAAIRAVPAADGVLPGSALAMAQVAWSPAIVFSVSYSPPTLYGFRVPLAAFCRLVCVLSRRASAFGVVSA